VSGSAELQNLTRLRVMEVWNESQISCDCYVVACWEWAHGVYDKRHAHRL